jgi:hypothetical protein
MPVLRRCGFAERLCGLPLSPVRYGSGPAHHWRPKIRRGLFDGSVARSDDARVRFEQVAKEVARMTLRESIGAL